MKLDKSPHRQHVTTSRLRMDSSELDPSNTQFHIWTHICQPTKRHHDQFTPYAQFTVPKSPICHPSRLPMDSSDVDPF